MLLLTNNPLRKACRISAVSVPGSKFSSAPVIALRGTLSSEPLQIWWCCHLGRYLKLFLSNSVHLYSFQVNVSYAGQTLSVYIVYNTLERLSAMEKSTHVILLLFWIITTSFLSKWLRPKGVQECTKQQICHSHSAPWWAALLLGEMGTDVGGLPSAFSQFVSGRRADGIFKKKMYFLKTGHGQK